MLVRLNVRWPGQVDRYSQPPTPPLSRRTRMCSATLPSLSRLLRGRLTRSRTLTSIARTQIRSASLGGPGWLSRSAMGDISGHYPDLPAPIPAPWPGAVTQAKTGRDGVSPAMTGTVTGSQFPETWRLCDACWINYTDYSRFTSQHFRLFHVSILSVQTVCSFLLM